MTHFATNSNSFSLLKDTPNFIVTASALYCISPFPMCKPGDHLKIGFEKKSYNKFCERERERESKTFQLSERKVKKVTGKVRQKLGIETYVLKRHTFRARLHMKLDGLGIPNFGIFWNPFSPSLTFSGSVLELGCITLFKEHLINRSQRAGICNVRLGTRKLELLWALITSPSHLQNVHKSRGL